MILINLAHPLTPDQCQQIEAMTGQKIARLLEQAVQFEVEQVFAPQVRRVVAQVGLTATEWQQAPLLVNLPALNFAAATVLAELHGRCGYFPPLVRTRPIKDSLPPRFEVAEIINLQGVREMARTTRQGVARSETDHSGPA
jgi:hypothetical protein